MAFWMAKAPIAQDTTIIGAMAENGTRRMAAKIGTVVSTITSPTTLPRYIEAIRPHTKSLCSTNSSGPGLSPHTIRPPSRIAAVPEPGNAERQHRQQRRGAGGVRRRLRREHAFDAALAETFRVLGEALGEVVAHERGRDRAARRDAEPAADGRRAQQRHPIARQLLPHLQHHAQADARGVAAQREPLLHRQQDFADAEQADDGDQEVDAAQQLARAEGHAQLAGHGVHADAGEQQAERHGDDGLVLVLAPEARRTSRR